MATGEDQPNGVQVVWFKRDLRIEDHAPLASAATRGPCLFLYVYEPEVLQAEDFDASHLDFINDSLRSLDQALRERGAALTLRHGAMPQVLDEIHHEFGIAGLWSHEETGNDITYQRDRRVAAWAKANRVTWHETPCNGVVRRLSTRDGWAAQWHARATAPLIAAPASLHSVQPHDPGEIMQARQLALPESNRSEVQPGGSDAARDTLRSFLYERGENYRKDMSSPGAGWTGCSRLSPYLAWGNLSVRQVYQLSRARKLELPAGNGRRRNQEGAAGGSWRASLSAFEQRLRWRCHFVQKLEDEPSIEFHNMNRAYDGIREELFDQSLFEAWCVGQTGYPMVDACMRALHQSGWINFRMRAMLMSFASYHLWLHWRPTALYLARLFLDYEPGIHFSQTQMQSGVTGINTVRIYSPAKQVIDNNPDGTFIRQYCPELAQVPSAYIAEPQNMPHDVQLASGCIIGQHYPAPIVEHRKAYAEARRRIYTVKGSASARALARNVYTKHGSRRRPRPRPASARR